MGRQHFLTMEEGHAGFQKGANAESLIKLVRDGEFAVAKSGIRKARTDAPRDDGVLLLNRESWQLQSACAKLGTTR